MLTTTNSDDVSFSSAPLAQQTQLLELQRDILASVAVSNDHEEQLAQLCKTAESMLPNAVASIMLLNDAKDALVVRAAPSIPQAAIEQLNGLQPGPEAGSCGTAVYCDKPVYVTDTMSDNRWCNVQDFAQQFNIHACWSHPIRNTDGEIAGSFALSSFETRAPSEFQKSLLEVCANLAGVILQRELLESDLTRLAHYDVLTSLPNRTHLLEKMTKAISQAASNKIALLYIDVDNFKFINDTFGHKTGDEVLTKLAQTMKNCLRQEDLLARVGGDEFILLIDDINKTNEAIAVAEKLLSEIQALTHAYQLDISASIGISVYPEDASTDNELMQHADKAMYAAKSSGKNRYHLFTGELTNLIKEQVQLINDLKRALKNEEFVLHYQPIFRANDESLHGVEALIRWAHPEKGLLSPIHFITTAEKNGLIGGITDWVLLESFRQTKAWLDKGCHFDRVSINLSAENIKLGFHEQVARLLKQTQCPSKHLQFEITETIVMEHGLGVIAELEKVRLLGITIALDDFGTGYSSLNQLKRLPVDKLKIDRSFIQDIPHDGDDVTLTNMIIAMSKHLSLSVVAEGVETEEQATFLKQAGCDYLQGFLYAKPMSEVELCRLFKPI